jgi:hypothetical protein
MLPTTQPSSNPTSASTTATGSCSCVLPEYLKTLALITSGNALLGAHTVYRGIAIGGVLSDPDTNLNKQISSNYVHPSYVFAKTSINMEFKGGVTNGATLADAGIDFEVLKCLAQAAVSSTSGSFKVVVLTRGGTYSTEDFRGPDGQGEDNGNTLVIFNTNEDVILSQTSSGRQFGPSILAPFSNVDVRAAAGFVDGYIVAKNLNAMDGASTTSLQFHGDYYKGGIVCDAAGTQVVPSLQVLLPLVVPTPSPTSPTVSIQGGCCSWNALDCGTSTWCNELQSNCEINCGGKWLSGTSSVTAPSLAPTTILSITSPPLSTSSPGTCSCVLPEYLKTLALITSGNALLGAHTVYRGIAIGGVLSDPDTNLNKQISSNYVHPSYVFAKTSINMEFKGGVTNGATLADAGIDFEVLKCLAQTAVSSTSGSFKVVVLTRGGTYSTEDFRGPDGQGEDNGNTLVIFNTNEDVILSQTSSGRQFGPSILAPFSNVDVRASAGFVDGYIVAKNLNAMDGAATTSLQFHGDYYKGGIVCG